MGNTLKEIKARMISNLSSESAKLEGSFNSDNIGAVATELARVYAEDIDTLLDKVFLDTTFGEYLDRRAEDFNMTRKDGESDDDFRERIYELIRFPRAPGNVNDYIAWAKEVAGVWRAKCFPLWNGNGTVKVSVVSPEGLPPDEETLQRTYEHIESVRPIGAQLTVSAAIVIEIFVEANVILDQTADIETCTDRFETVMCEMLRDIAYDDKTEYLSYYKISEMLFSVSGIIDVLDFTINEGKASIPVGKEQVLVLCGVKLHAS